MRPAALLALACLLLWLATPGQSERERALRADRDDWRRAYHAADAEVTRLRRMADWRK